MSLDDPNVDMQAGRVMTDMAAGTGPMDPASFGVASKLARELFGVGRFGAPPTTDLVRAGQNATDPKPRMSPEEAEALAQQAQQQQTPPPEGSPPVDTPMGDEGVPGTLGKDDMVPGVHVYETPADPDIILHIEKVGGYYEPNLENLGQSVGGRGVATGLYLDALQDAAREGMGWRSDEVLSPQAKRMYERLVEQGVPLKKKGKVWVAEPEDLRTWAKSIGRFDEGMNIAGSPEKRLEELQRTRFEDMERRTWERNINLDYIENPEDIGPILEAHADLLPTRERESLAQVAEEADYAGLSQYLSGEASGNLNARQLVAGRNMLVTVTDNVKRLAAEIASDTDVSAEKILQFEQAQNQAVMLQKFMQGQIGETARALNSMKIVARTLKSQDINQIAGSAGDTSTSSIVKAKRLVELQEGGANEAELIDEMNKLGYFGRSVASIVNYWTASILSGTTTQLINLVSNASWSAMNTMAIKPLAAAVSPIRQSLAGRVSWVGGGPGVTNAEAIAEGLAARQGIKEAVQMAGRLWRHGSLNNQGEYVSIFGDQKINDIQRDTMQLGEIGFSEDINLRQVPVVSHLLNLAHTATKSVSYGLLSAGDEFFKAMAYRQSLYAQAARMAQLENLAPEQTLDRMQELLQPDNITKTMHDTAMANAERLTFTNEVGGAIGMVSNFMKNFVNAVPVMKFIAPFISTPTALLDRTIKISPLAPIQQEFRDAVRKGGPEADVAIAELLFGTTMLGIMMMLYHEGAVTGKGPENYKQRKALEALGWQANSIRMGDTYVSYARGADPLGMAFASVFNMLDEMHYSQQDPGISDWALGVPLALAKHFKDNLYLKGIADTMAILDGRMNVSKQAAKTTAQFVPTFLRDVKKATEGDAEIPVVPTSHSFWEMLKGYTEQRIPGVDGDNTMPLRYWNGDIVIPGNGEALYLYNSLSPVKVSVGKNEPNSAALVQNGVIVSPPSSELSMGGAMSVDLLNDLSNGVPLYDRLIQLVGESRKAAVSSVVDTKQYREWVDKGMIGPNSVAAMALEKALSAGARAGKQQFLAELIKNPPDPDVHGEMAMLLDPPTLKRLLRQVERGEMTDATRTMMIDANLKTLPTREPIEVPLFDMK